MPAAVGGERGAVDHGRARGQGDAARAEVRAHGGERLGDERRRGRRAGDEAPDRAPIDGGHDGRGPLQHRVLAREHQLPGRAHRGGRGAHVSSTTRAPGPGAATMVRSTPGTAASAPATAFASAAAHSALTCGPASMVK